MVTELTHFILNAAFLEFDLEDVLIFFLITVGFLWLARTVCYSQLNLTSGRLLSTLMWFLCCFWHTRYVESGSFRNLIQFFSLSCL